MLWRREVSLGSVYQEVYETEVSSFRSRRLVGGIKTRSDEGPEEEGWMDERASNRL